MADDNTQSALQIPPEIQARFPELIELIIGSESMNVNERQYWINILPIMTPEQIQNLHDILQNERRQLAAIDAKYAKDVDEVGTKAAQDQMAQERHIKREKLYSSEQAQDSAEQEMEQDILDQINSL